MKKIICLLFSVLLVFTCTNCARNNIVKKVVCKKYSFVLQLKDSAIIGNSRVSFIAPKSKNAEGLTLSQFLKNLNDENYFNNECYIDSFPCINREIIISSPPAIALIFVDNPITFENRKKYDYAWVLAKHYHLIDKER